MATYYVDVAVGNDANAGTSEGAGNAWATIQQALTTVAIGDTVYVKASGTYSISAGLTASTAGSSSIPTRVYGYTSTVGDGGKPTVLTTAAINLLTVTMRGMSFINFLFDGDDIGVDGISLDQNDLHLINCDVKDCTGVGIAALEDTTRVSVADCEVTGCAGTAGIVMGSGMIVRSKVSYNTTTGIVIPNAADNVLISYCEITNNSGASSDGIRKAYYNAVLQNNTIDSNGRDGIRDQGFNTLVNEISNNIITNNGGYGLNQTDSLTTLQETDPSIQHNAYFSNTSGDRNNVVAGDGDVILTSTPYNDSAGNDYTLNNTAGGGASCRAAGVPTNVDLGANQSASGGGGGATGGLLTHAGMAGGINA